MVKVNFSAYANYVTDTLYQWDIGRVLNISGIDSSVAPEVHFSNANMERAIVRQATVTDNVISVSIPNSILQMPLTIHAHVGIYEADAFKVIEKIEIPVIARTRPTDYQLDVSDEEVYSFNRIENQINNLETSVENMKTQSIQSGVWGVTNPSETNECAIVFDKEFSEVPIVVANIHGTDSPFDADIVIKTVTTNGVIFIVRNNSENIQTLEFSWIAVGKM